MPRGFTAKMWMPNLQGLIRGYDESILRFYWYRVRLPDSLGRWVVRRGYRRMGVGSDHWSQ